MHRSFTIALFLISSLVLQAQSYNPFVSDGVISPSPLPTAESGGTGTLGFNTGNTGTDTLNSLGQNRMTLTINLFNGEPNNSDPIAALGGSAKELFTWTYSEGTYTGRQSAAILPRTTRTISIAYKVTRNSTRTDPRNGFRATIAPGPYNESNSTQDDAIEILTYTQCDAPPAPVIGNVTQPTCSAPAGSITLTGMPSTGTWTLSRYPGPVNSTGSGTTVTVTGLAGGTYYFTVTTAEGCTSPESAEVDIDTAPEVPDPPDIGTVTQPTCTTATGSVVLNGLPSSGTWTVAIYPGGATRTGSGTTTTISGLGPGTWNFTVTAGGCTSQLSGNAVINPQPVVPSAPIPGTITQPTCQVSTGSVVLNGLPATGTWTLTRYPGEVQRTGTGTSYTFTGLEAGNTYSFTVATSAGCVSARSSNVIINQAADVPSAPSIGTVTQPTCEVSTGSVVVNGLPATGTWTLIRNPGDFRIQGSGSSVTDSGVVPGTYTYTVTNAEGCTSSSSSSVTIRSSGTAPPEPVVRVDCFVAGIVTVIEPVGTGLTYSLDNGPFRDSRTFVGVPNGLHTVTVRNSAGCTTTGPQFSVSCGCVNRPTISLSSRTGDACGTTAFTVSGNTFGGSATAVTITEDGAGSLSPTEVTSSPFSFTYTPAAADVGKTVTITLTTNNPIGAPCTEATATFTLTVNPVPASPGTGTITHPTCTTSTGSVVVNGLPSGSWTLVRNPGSVTITGSGTSTTVRGIESGTYTFTVSVNGCSSAPSAPVQINEQPAIPPAPVAGPVVHPTCTVGTGSITLTGLPSSGTWTLVRYPGSVSLNGNGSSIVIQSLTPGTYNFTVTGAAGCPSPASANIIINAQPPTPLAPVPGNITAPTCPSPEGRVVLNGLPSGTWTVTSSPALINQTGSGSSATIRGLLPGTYTFTVTNSAGCVSDRTGNVVIPQIPNAPVVTVTDPDPVCSPSTIDLTAATITAGSTPGLAYTYWTNSAATIPYGTPDRATNGIYYIKGTNTALCSDIEPVTVIVMDATSADAGPDQDLNYAFSTTLDANQPVAGESGTWTVFAGTGIFTDNTSPITTVTGLKIGENIFVWNLSNGACPSSSDTVLIFVRDIVVPTLITPNEDGVNDVFVLSGIELMDGNQLFIFDRRGVVVYKDKDYRNDWNGVDYNNNPLPADTYFFILKTGNGRERSGYVVIRK